MRAAMEDPAQVTDAVGQAVEVFGRLDFLVNNAGVFPYGPVDKMTLADSEHTMAVHVRAVFVAVQAAAPHMGVGGRIVSIGSSLVDRVPDPGLSLYVMSKSAVVGLTKALARELGPRGINVVVINPGPVDTEMNPADGPDAGRELAYSAVGRFATPAEIAATVAHIVGPGGD